MTHFKLLPCTKSSAHVFWTIFSAVEGLTSGPSARRTKGTGGGMGAAESSSSAGPPRSHPRYSSSGSARGPPRASSSRNDDLRGAPPFPNVGISVLLLGAAVAAGAVLASKISEAVPEEPRARESWRGESSRKERKASEEEECETCAPPSSSSSGRRECVVCLTRPPDVVFPNCRHLVMCSQCVDVMMKGPVEARMCPLDRKPLGDTPFRVFT